MAAFLALPAIFVIVDGVIVGLTTLGTVMLAVIVSIIQAAEWFGISTAMTSQTGVSELVNSLSLQLNAQQAAQLTRGLLPQLDQPTLQLPSHTFPLRQPPSRNAPDRTTPLQLNQPWQPIVINPSPPPRKTPPPPPPPNPQAGQTNWQPLIDLITQTVKPNIDGKLDSIAQPLAALGPIAQALGALLPAAGQLGPLLTNLVNAFQAADLAGIQTALTELVNCVCPNLDQIAKSLATSAAQGDVPQPIIDQMIKEGALSPALGQLAGGAPWSYIISALIGSIGRYLGGELGEVKTGVGAMFQNLIEPWANKLIAFIKASVDPMLTTLASDVAPYASKVENLGAEIVGFLGKLETTLPRACFDAVNFIITGGNPVTADNVEEIAFTMFGTAFIVGQGLHLVGGFASWLGYPMSSVWSNNAMLMVDLLAFDEIKSALHRQYFPHAIGERARQHYAKQFKPFIAGRQEALAGFARGKITEAQAAAILDYAGLDPTARPLLGELAYRPVSAFMLASGFQDQDIPADQLNAALQDMALNPNSKALMTKVVTVRSLANVRTTYIAQSIAAAAKGSISIAQLDEALATAEYGQAAIDLVHKNVTLAQLDAIAAAVERDAISELEGGLITADQAKGLMASAGIQDWRINVTVELGATKAALKAALKAQSEQRTLAHQTLMLTFNAISAQYADGAIDAPTLTAGLTTALGAYLLDLRNLGESDTEIASSTQLGAAMIAARVSMLTARRAGTPRLVFGLMLDPAHATLLRERVASIKEAVVRTDMGETTALDALAALGIDQQNATSLVDEWITQMASKGSYPLGKNKPTFQ